MMTMAATGAAIVIMDKLLNEKAAPIIESIEFPEEAEKDDAEAAKTAEALRVMNQKIRDRELEKLYLCAVLGCPTPSAGTLEGFIVKDEAKKQVSIRSKPVPGGRKAITKYRTLATKGNLSLVECDLITGRTHQIRAMMAHAGHPLLGDGKYGSEKVNRQYGRKHQALWSWKLTFQFTTDAGELDYLNGRSWQVEHVDFVEEYFPGVAVGCGADSSL